jgi:aminoglycoside 6'-N-acetyltransferase
VAQLNNVRLRRTTPDDSDVVTALFHDPGLYPEWDGAMKSDEEIAAGYLGGRFPQVECFLIEEAGAVVGFAQIHVADDGGEGGGMDLVLLPHARGRGIGSVVVRVLADMVRVERRWRRFTVDPDVSNTRGVNFWAKAGFVAERVVYDDAGRPPYWIMARPTRTPPGEMA